MSKFKELVEEIKSTNEITYQLLTQEMRDNLYKQICEIDIDPSELESAVWNDNPYDVEPQLALGSGMYEYNEDEYFNAQCEQMISYIKADGAVQYLWDLIPEDKQEDDEYERRRKLERQRYMRERELMDKEEKVNAFNDKVDEEDEESVEDLEEDLF